MPSKCCISRLTPAIPIQQQSPIKIGFPPVFTSLMMLVFRPIAAIAMTIKNLLISFKGFVTAAGRWKNGGNHGSKQKKQHKEGENLFQIDFCALCAMPFPAVRTNASTSVIGMIASVRVSLTIAAASSVLLPWIPSQACAAAVTEEVSLIAVPANRPKPSLDRPSSPPSVGKISAAITLKQEDHRNGLRNLLIIRINARAHDIGPLPRRRLARECARTYAPWWRRRLIDHHGTNRFAAARQFGEPGNIEIAKPSHGGGARDGRGGHHQ